MGYPMRVGYRNPQTSGSPGLSNAADAVFKNVADFLSHNPELMKIPANDILKRRLALFLRLNPYLRLAMTAYDLYQAVNPNIPAHLGLCTGGNIGPWWGNINCGNAVPYTNKRGIQMTYNSLSGNWVTNFAMTDLNPNFVLQTVGNVQLNAQIVQTPAQRYKQASLGMPNMPYRIPPRPRFDPWFDPFDLPINQPVPAVDPWPWPLIPYRPRPGFDPHPVPAPPPRPAPGPGPVPAPGTDPGPAPGPAPDPSSPSPPKEPSPEQNPKVKVPRRPGPKFRERRDRAGELARNSDPVVEMVRQSSAARPRKPPPRTAEGKVGGTGGRLIWGLANLVTEGKDFLEAMWKALPENKRTKQHKKSKGFGKYGERKTPPVMQEFKDVYHYLRTYDPLSGEAAKFWNDALDNFIENQIEDYVFGKTGQAVARQSKASGRPIGFAAGPAI